MARYAVAETQREGEPTLRLRDEETGAGAEVWPGCGFNAFALDLPAPEGAAWGPRDRGAGPPTLAEIRRRPSWWGIPLLFPFPGAIPKGEYEFEGRRLRLGREGSRWSPRGAKPPGRAATSTASSWTPPGRSPAWRRTPGAPRSAPPWRATPSRRCWRGSPSPSGWRPATAWTAPACACVFRPTTRAPALPRGFGAHPFFRLPLGPAGSPGECLISIPAGPALGRAAPAHDPGGESRLGGHGGRGRGAPPGVPRARPAHPRPLRGGGLQRALHRPGPEDGWIAASVIDPPTGARR